MAYALTFEIACVTPTLNQLLRMHHGVQRKRQRALAHLVAMATIGRRPPAPLRRARVTIERHSSGSPDHDNLVGGVKPLVDVLLTPQLRGLSGGRISTLHRFGVGFVADDGPGVLDLVVRSVRAPRTAQRMVITIEELGNGP